MIKNFIEYVKTRKNLVLLFVLSTISSFIFLCLALSWVQSNSALPPSQNSNLDIVAIGSIVAILTSCTTSIATFFGLIFTWTVGWRKENRETKISILEKERLQTALEREKLELEKLKAENKKVDKK